MESFTIAFYGEFGSHAAAILQACLGIKGMLEVKFSEARLNGKRRKVADIRAGNLGVDAFFSCCLIAVKSRSWEGVLLHIEVASDVVFVSAETDFFDLRKHRRHFEAYMCNISHTICGIGYTLPLRFKPTLYAATPGYFSTEFRKHHYFEFGNHAMNWMYALRSKSDIAATDVRGVYELNYLTVKQVEMLSAMPPLQSSFDSRDTFAPNYAGSQLALLKLDAETVIAARQWFREQRRE